MHDSILAAVTSLAIATVGTVALPTIEPNYDQGSGELFYGQEWSPCEHEDSLGCHWDAANRGNGTGNSFIALKNGDRIYDLELPACEHEDSLGCYWDATERGNGQGNSFVALEDGELIYLP